MIDARQKIVGVIQLQLLLQCSPYQAVTVKIYCLKQQFSPPATTEGLLKINIVSLKNAQVAIRSDQRNE